MPIKRYFVRKSALNNLSNEMITVLLWILNLPYNWEVVVGAAAYTRTSHVIAKETWVIQCRFPFYAITELE